MSDLVEPCMKMEGRNGRGKVADTNTAWKDAIDEDGSKYWFNEETEKDLR